MQMLDETTREQVLGRLPAAHRDALREATGSNGEMAENRRFMREAVLNIHERNSENLAESVHASLTAIEEPVAAAGPLDALRDVHPAALALAMQGERAEAWAVVLHHLADNSRAALVGYLDPEARRSIAHAQRRQAQLAPQLQATATRAIAQAIVPRALQEHRRIMASRPPVSRR